MPTSSLIALAAAVLHVPGQPPERVLEIGCGDGEAVLFLAREYPSARVRGVDASPDTIRETVARVGLDPEGRVAFKQGKSRALPFPDGFFDLVAQARGPLHPGEIARVTRPNGYLVLVGRWRWLEWRLGGRGFVPVESGEADGERFHVLRLEAAGLPPE